MKSLKKKKKKLSLTRSNKTTKKQWQIDKRWKGNQKVSLSVQNQVNKTAKIIDKSKILKEKLASKYLCSKSKSPEIQASAEVSTK